MKKSKENLGLLSNQNGGTHTGGPLCCSSAGTISAPPLAEQRVLIQSMVLPPSWLIFDNWQYPFGDSCCHLRSLQGVLMAFKMYLYSF